MIAQAIPRRIRNDIDAYLTASRRPSSTHAAVPPPSGRDASAKTGHEAARRRTPRRRSRRRTGRPASRRATRSAPDPRRSAAASSRSRRRRARCRPRRRASTSRALHDDDVRTYDTIEIRPGTLGSAAIPEGGCRSRSRARVSSVLHVVPSVEVVSTIVLPSHPRRNVQSAHATRDGPTRRRPPSAATERAAAAGWSCVIGAMPAVARERRAAVRRAHGVHPRSRPGGRSSARRRAGRAAARHRVGAEGRRHGDGRAPGRAAVAATSARAMRGIAMSVYAR